MISVAISILLTFCSSGQIPIQIRGWNILSDYREDDIVTINAAKSYNINHLQLSHDLVMDLQEIRDPERQKLVNELAGLAHKSGIKEVVAWDHALYNLKYYPDKFKTGPGGTIDLDNPDFWEWFKNDYRSMLALIPGIDGLVLTFIETGARAENQHSVKLKTGAEKLAAVVDAVADVVCEEMSKKLYIRTFAYTDAEYRNTIGCIQHIKNRDIILMMKETPHDFFLTHPNDKYAGTINRPTIMEFDCGNEFNGQGIIANTWPEYIIRRWSDLIKRPNVIGYVARTDRYRDTRIVGTPNEILLYTLKRYTEDQSVTEDQVYNEFISGKYGKKAVRLLKPGFKLSYDIVSSSLYTLGTNLANHSKMDFDPYKSSYGRHVSGKWIDPPIVKINHEVNREFHYWTDVIEHISPARFKSPSEALRIEAPHVLDNGWVTAEEKMNEEYLKYIIAEKKFGVKKAEKALNYVTRAKKSIDVDQYNQVYNLFQRTLITSRIYEAVATAYFGYRIYSRGEEFRTEWLVKTIQEALDKMLIVASEIENFTENVPRGQWNWRGDAATAREYHEKITKTGWKEYGNVVFNLKKSELQASINDRPWQYVATRMPDEWYGSEESVRVAENVLLYQRDIGGWPKNTPFHRSLSESEKAKINDEKGLNDAIFDNSATTTEMKFLARMFNNTDNTIYKDSFNRGLKFILDAQYENGGWPMFWPLRKGYYTHITFNDNAIVNILLILRDIKDKQPLFAKITSQDNLLRVEKAYIKGIEIILKTQIVVKGKPTVWCAQHDENTLLAAPARSYELPSFSGAESVGIIKLLMEIPDPSPAIINSVKSAVEWLDSHRIKNTRWDIFTNQDGKRDRRIVSDPKAGDMWARFYDIETELPFVCDRDGIKKKTLGEIGYERRNGYSWYTNAPLEVIEMYQGWKSRWMK